MSLREGFTGDGLLLVDKPAGVTSFAVVDHVRRTMLKAFPDLDPRRSRRRRRPRRQLPRFKCGHAGTLDPLATGLLLVLTGKASRLANFLLGQDKTYTATVRFGCATDSHDRDGEPVGQVPPPEGVMAVQRALEGFRGRIEQVPPVYSALKRDGQPLHRLARQGREVAAPEPRAVTISRLELTGNRWGEEPGAARDTRYLAADGRIYEADLLVECSSGTYIRSLARDVARAAGSEAYLQTLRRTTIGPFTVDDALRGVLDVSGEDLAATLLPPAAAVPHLPRLTVSVAEAAGLRQGRQPEPAWLERLDGEPDDDAKHGRLFVILDEAGRLVAVGRSEDSTGQPRLVLVVPQENLRETDQTDS